MPATRLRRIVLTIVAFLVVLAVLWLVYYIVGLGASGGAGTDEYPPLP